MIFSLMSVHVQGLRPVADTAYKVELCTASQTSALVT